MPRFPRSPIFDIFNTHGAVGARSDTGGVAMGRVALLVALMWVGWAFPAAADFAQDKQRCSRDPNPDVMFKSCTALIMSGRLDHKEQATAFNNRGNANRLKGQFDLAITNFDQAIHLNPSDGTFYYNRAGKNGWTDSAVDGTQAAPQRPAAAPSAPIDRPDAIQYLGRAWAPAARPELARHP